MKTFTTRFRSLDKIDLFIEENSIKNSKNLLIQISSPFKYKQTLKDILKLLNSKFADAKIIGISSSKSLYESKITKDDIIISFTKFDKAILRLEHSFSTNEHFDYDKNLAKNIILDDTKALILFSTFDLNGQRLLENINKIDDDILVTGIAGSDELEFKDSFVISNTDVIESGYVVVSISGDIDVKNFYKIDWDAISKEFVVTKSKANRVFTLDDSLVVDIYKSYTGIDIKNLQRVSLQFPFIVQRDGFDLTMQIVDINSDGSVIFNTDIKEGEKLRLSFCDIDKSLNYKLPLNNSYEDIFLYSSVAREAFIPKLHSIELDQLKSQNIGFGAYGYGEYFKNSDLTLSLNNSICGLMLSENKNSIKTDRKLNKKYLNSDYETIKILSNIAKSSSNELELLNKKLQTKIDNSIKDIRKKESLMIHNSRLAQLGEMLALIAHQWRQPLSAISATTTGMQIKLEIDSADKKYLLNSLDHIEKYVLHLSDTIDDFTNFFKPNKKKESITVGEIIKKSLFISSSLLSKNSIEIVQKYNSKDELYTYPNELVQVILNLIKNSVNILVKRDIKDPTIFIKEYKKENLIVIEISDNGGGIDSKIFDKIFEPYFSSNSAKDSLGLGLYMSKFIIEESCKGSLDVSNSSNGAVFKITLDSLNS